MQITMVDGDFCLPDYVLISLAPDPTTDMGFSSWTKHLNQNQYIQVSTCTILKGKKFCKKKMLDVYLLFEKKLWIKVRYS